MRARNPVLRARYLLVRRWPFSLLSRAGLGLGAILKGSHNAETPCRVAEPARLCPAGSVVATWGAVGDLGAGDRRRRGLLGAAPMIALVVGAALGIAAASDVGPSAGYFGALGLVSARLLRPWLWVSQAGIFLGTVVALLRLPKVGQRLAPAIAFPLGWISSGLGQ
jgi:hypothetical protein